MASFLVVADQGAEQIAHVMLERQLALDHDSSTLNPGQQQAVQVDKRTNKPNRSSRIRFFCPLLFLSLESNFHTVCLQRTLGERPPLPPFHRRPIRAGHSIAG